MVVGYLVISFKKICNSFVVFTRMIPLSDFMTERHYLPHLSKVTGIVSIAILMNHPSKSGLPKRYMKLFLFKG